LGISVKILSNVYILFNIIIFCNYDVFSLSLMVHPVLNKSWENEMTSYHKAGNGVCVISLIILIVYFFTSFIFHIWCGQPYMSTLLWGKSSITTVQFFTRWVYCQLVAQTVQWLTSDQKSCESDHG